MSRSVADKMRGGYYTSIELAQWLCSWAILDKNERVLEPSCGDGIFLEASMNRLLDRGSTRQIVGTNLQGVEIDAKEAALAVTRLENRLGKFAKDIVTVNDFFAWSKIENDASFDVVVGNPPFIRYQSFPEPHRTRAMKLMADHGLTPNRLTNIWVPFVVGAVASLRIGGRLALVLPAELLQVSYASQLRAFLTDRFEQINLIACNELFFDQAEQEVILLLAKGARVPVNGDNNQCQVAMTALDQVSDLFNSPPERILKSADPKTIQHDSEKWLKYFLSATEISFMRTLREAENTTNLGDFADVNVGVVTGKNNFFVLNQEEVELYGLSKYVTPIISRSAQLKGARIGKRDWEQLVSGNHKVFLLNLAPINGTRLSKRLEGYVRLGEENEVHLGYKCSIRDPWYAVPSTWEPDAFLFRQIYDFPRMVRNTAAATSTDTIHRVRCKTNPQNFLRNTFTYLTAASAEIEGRSYGGGVLELEPSEARRLLVPSSLEAGLPLAECDKLIRMGRLSDVLVENAQLILQEQMGLSQKECTMLKSIWEQMRDRRLARKRKAAPKIST